jgi:hypothetical protein
MGILKIIKAELSPIPSESDATKKTKKTKTSKKTIDLPAATEKNQDRMQIDSPVEKPITASPKDTVPKNPKQISPVSNQLKTEAIPPCQGEITTNLAYDPNYTLTFMATLSKSYARQIATKLIKQANAHPENIPKTWEIMCDASTSVRVKIKLLSEVGWKDSMPIKNFRDLYIFARILEQGCEGIELDLQGGRGLIPTDNINKILNQYRLIISE